MSRARFAAVTLDCAVIMALATLALWPLRSTYATGPMLLTGLLAALWGVALVLVCSRLPGVVLVAVVPIGWILLGGPVALRSAGAGMGVPNGTTLSDVMAGSWTGWGETLTTLPTVDMSGAPALVPFLIGYLGAALAAALAVRTRSPGLPVVPLLVAVCAGLAMSRPEPATEVWLPLVVAVVILGWVIARAHRSQYRPGDAAVGAGRLLARGWLSRVVWALVLLVATAAVTSTYVGVGRSAGTGRTLRGHVGALPDVAALDRPLSRFRTFTKQRAGAMDNVYDKLLFTVRGAPQGSRLRLVTLDHYDGTQWLPGNDTIAGDTDARFLRMDSHVQNRATGRPVKAEVTVAKAYRGDWVPTIGSLTSLSFLYTDVDDRRSLIRYNLATSSAEVPIGLGASNDYSFTAVEPPSRLGPRMSPWPRPVLSVAGQDQARLFVDAWGGRSENPIGKVFTLADYLRNNGRYSDGAQLWEQQFLPGQDLNRLLAKFLGAPLIVGDDEQYAATMALLANAAGVPARVVVGAQLPRDGKVRGKDLHAWVELRIADGSWRVLPTERFMGNRPPPRGYRPPPKVYPRPPKQTKPPAQQPQQPQTKPRPKPKQSAHQDHGTSPLAWLLVLVALAVAAPPTGKAVRHRLRRTRGRGSDRLAGAWAELVDTARDLGQPVPRGSSRPAQARMLVFAADADTLAVRADGGVFGVLEPDDANVAAYWEDVDRERARLRGQASLWRRIWAPLNPGSLLHPDPPARSRRSEPPREDVEPARPHPVGATQGDSRTL